MSPISSLFFLTLNNFFQDYIDIAYYMCYIVFLQTNQKLRKWRQMMVSYLIFFF